MKKLLAWLMAVTLTFQLVTPVFAEEIEETQAATEAVEVETEAPVTEIPTTEPTTTDAMETAAPEETSAPTEPQPTTEVTEATETTASTEETTSAATEPIEETTEPTLDLFAEDENVVASCEARTSYSCVLVSAPGVESGKTYTLTCGDASSEITMDGLVYSNVDRAQAGGPGSAGKPQGSGQPQQPAASGGSAEPK